MSIVERIKARCKEKGTTMNALEKELGFGNGNIRRWDEREPGANRVLILANRLEVTVEWILTGKESADLTPEEQELVDCYRQSNDQGKRAILGQARLQKQELESSSSKIG